jgi:hypothetical protein
MNTDFIQSKPTDFEIHFTKRAADPTGLAFQMRHDAILLPECNRAFQTCRKDVKRARSHARYRAKRRQQAAARRDQRAKSPKTPTATQRAR